MAARSRGMRLRILEAAKQEFSTHGLAGARVDRIAAKAGANKRMLYYHVGNKDELYLAVLEGAYDKIRSEERGSISNIWSRPRRIKRLIEFTWNYFLRNPEFLSLLQTENLARAKHLKRSTRVKSMHSPFVEMIGTVVRRGVDSRRLPGRGRSRAALHLDRGALLLLSLEFGHAERDLRPRPAGRKKPRTSGSAHAIGRASMLAAAGRGQSASFGCSRFNTSSAKPRKSRAVVAATGRRRAAASPLRTSQ